MLEKYKAAINNRRASGAPTTTMEKVRVSLSMAGFGVMFLGGRALHWPLAEWVGISMVVASALLGLLLLRKYQRISN
jgi:hypothetical protein